MKGLALPVLLAGWLVLGPGRPALAQTQDTVYFIDPMTHKEDQVRGAIKEESPRGITVEVRKATRTIPASAIEQVIYKHPKVSALEFRAPYGKLARAQAPGVRPKNRKEYLAEALDGYQ